MPLDPTDLLAPLAAATALLLALYALQLRTREADWADVGWAAALGGSAVWWAFSGPGDLTARVIAGVIGGLWGGRLTWHLVVDRALQPGEDGRYAAMRRHFGDRAAAHFLWWFVAQAVLAVGLSVPFWLAAHTPEGVGRAWQIAAVGLFVSGWIIEATADSQLAAFRRDPSTKGTVCDRGFWRYSRHPNYFGEWVMWCGIASLALPAPYGIWSLTAPAILFLLLTRVTGIPYTELQALRSRGDAYRDYQATTNAFFPGPRRPLPTNASGNAKQEES